MTAGSDDPTGWFERLYRAAAAGERVVPWDRGTPQRLLVQWAEAASVAGEGRRALVVGCGVGHDAEYVAGLGFRTVAFDVAPAAIEAARRRVPNSNVEYVVADLLDPPAAWREAFDLVVESLTAQSLPDPPRRGAIAAIGRFVAPGGTLLVVAAARDDDGRPVEGPPWPLPRAEIDSFATGGLEAVRVEHLVAGSDRRWRAELRRPPRRVGNGLSRESASA